MGVYEARPTARLITSVTEHPHTLMRYFNARNERYIMVLVYFIAVESLYVCISAVHSPSPARRNKTRKV